MAELVKIFEVALHAAFTEDAAECYQFHKVLKDNGIPFAFMSYNDHVEAQQATLAALSTWRFGTEYEQRTFTKFPILIYKEAYNDWTTSLFVAETMEELLASTVITRKELVK